VIGLISRLTARVTRLSTTARLAWLNGVLLVVLALALAMVVARHDTGDMRTAEITAVVTAATVCTLSANAALILALLWHGTPNGVVGALGGTMVGMFPPLVLGTVLQRRGGPLAEAGVFGWIVVFYLSALVVKTLLVAPSVGPAVAATDACVSKAGA